MQQQVLPLGHVPAMRRDDFMVSACNAAALAYLDLWPEWPVPCLLLQGAAGCGKTHLLQIWAEKTGALLLPAAGLTEPRLAQLLATPAPVAIDDLDEIIGVAGREQALFHLYNRWRASGTGLVLASRQPVAQAAFALPDLASRLRSLPSIEVALPDDLLLARLLAKLFADRQITVPAAVVTYLVGRMERSFGAAGALVETLDRAALAGGRAITIGLARDVLAQAG